MPLTPITQPHMSTPSPSTPWFELPHAPASGTLVARQDAVADGQALMVALDTGGGVDQPFRLIVRRSGDEFKAFANRCAHFGIPLAAKQSQLLFKPHISITCNAHYARYRWADGTCESGECDGEGLIPVPLTLQPNGDLCIGGASLLEQ